jgi:ribosome-binding ATPase YchF (GTP1/OBG family)
VSLQVGIVGLPGSGKTTLFNALTHGHAQPHEYGKEHVGMAPVPDERLEQVARVSGSQRSTPAALRMVDAPGTGSVALGNLRRADALLAVLDAFSPGAQPREDRETLGLELLVADRDHVERRLERVRRQAKSGDPKLRQEEADLEAVLAHVDSGRSLAEWSGSLPPELEPLTTKPLLPVENGPGAIDAKLEAELAELPEDEAAAFRDGPSALSEVLRRLFEALDLITVFTANENEARTLILRRGSTALDAAAGIHSDLARGFIRCEVIRWDDLVECGSHAEARRRGLERLEGKAYEVEDGEVLTIRFNV